MCNNLNDLDQMFLEIEKDDTFLSLENIDDVIRMHDSFLKTLVGDRSEYLEGLKENYRRIFISKYFCFIQRLLGQEEDIEFYQGDIDLLKKAIDLTMKFQDCQTQLMGILNEDNYKDVSKMMLFTDYYYQFNANYIDEQRDVLRTRQKGISFSSTDEMKCNNADDVLQFVLERLPSKKLDKRMEKVKKM